MGIDYFTNPLSFLLEIIFSTYVLLILLRFLLQLVRADFYNPVSRFLVKVTNPALVPFRRLIPGLRGIDWAAIVLMIGLLMVQHALLGLLHGAMKSPLYLGLMSIRDLIDMTLNIYLFSILILVVMSWVSPHSYHPAVSLLHSLTQPLLARVRRLIPPVSGLDLSPMVAGVFLIIAKMLLIPPLQHLINGGSTLTLGA